MEGWKMTLVCTRAEAEQIASAPDDFADLTSPPVLVVSEPDEANPDRWRLDAYFEGKPPRELLRRVARLVPSAREKDPRAKPLPDTDWVTLGQAGFAPIVAGRFHVRTPEHRPRDELSDIVIPAGLAFGTGQHATTSGCLSALDALRRRGKLYRNILDLGTGTALLAIAAQRLWPRASVIASDIDAQAVAVARANADANGAPRIATLVADGLSHRALVKGAPYDLVIANILAQPLVEMAPWVAASVARRGTLLLAGLLDTQVEGVARAYKRRDMRLADFGTGQWPVLRLIAR